MESDDDYMNMNLEELEKKTEKEQLSYQRQRELEIAQQRKDGYNMPKKLKEVLNREKALTNPIQKDNLGFKLLQKMGQSGIGVEREEKEKLNAYLDSKKQKMEYDKMNYEKIVAIQYNERQTKKDLNSARMGIEDNKMWFSYSKSALNVKSKKSQDTEEFDYEIKDESSDEAEEENPLKKLREIVEYLRSEYCYCLWCGIEYESLEDIKDNCPGDTYEDH